MSLEIAITYHQQGDLSKAEEQYRKILQEEPENVDALHLLGVLLSQMARYESAAELIKKAIDIRPQAQFYNNLGAVYFHQGDFDAAILSSEKALQLNPDLTDAYYNHGNALFQLGKFEEALRAYEGALQKNHDSVEAHYNKAITLMELDRTSEAADELLTVTRLEPEHVDSYNKLFQVLESLGRTEDAKLAYAKLQDVTGENKIIPFLTAPDQPGDTLLPIKIKGDIIIGVPNNIQLMTPYILLEQEDWFEDEIKFIRKMLQPGMNAIDIGANYGVYSLSIARAILPHGTIWSFEPTSLIIPYLEWSMDENGLDNMFLIEAALSDHEGKAWLRSNINSELNEIENETGIGKESVDLMCIDQCMARYNWKEIDFIKLDAEGQESNIIQGGSNFLTQQSPLVLIELKHNDILNVDLVRQFESLNYSSYKLIPGLDILVPFSLDTEIDPFLLNIFCCKNDRADKLSDTGFLTKSDPEFTIDKTNNFECVIEYLNKFPYAKGNIEKWNNNFKNCETGLVKYYQALLCYVLAHQVTNPGKAYSYLWTCRMLMEEVIQDFANLFCLQTYSRVLWEIGERAHSLYILKQLENYINNEDISELDEPFFTVSENFDFQDPAGQFKNWCLSSVLEKIELLQHYSSYFNNEHLLANYEKFNSLGFRTPAMERRNRLIHLRSSKNYDIDKSSILSNSSDNNLNSSYWS